MLFGPCQKPENPPLGTQGSRIHFSERNFIKKCVDFGPSQKPENPPLDTQGSRIHFLTRKLIKKWIDCKLCQKPGNPLLGIEVLWPGGLEA